MFLRYRSVDTICDHCKMTLCNDALKDNIMTASKTARSALAPKVTIMTETPSIPLKSIYRDIMNDSNAGIDLTLTDKKMRARLRVAYRDTHLHNTSWVFTPSHADDVRAMFDPAFATKLIAQRERAAKADARAPRVRKVKAITVAIAEPVVADTDA